MSRILRNTWASPNIAIPENLTSSQLGTAEADLTVHSFDTRQPAWQDFPLRTSIIVNHQPRPTIIDHQSSSTGLYVLFQSKAWLRGRGWKQARSARWLNNYCWLLVINENWIILNMNHKRTTRNYHARTNNYHKLLG